MADWCFLALRPRAHTGAHAPLALPQAELAAKAERVSKQPVVLQGGAHVAAKYREVVLQPTDKTAHGRAVWSTAAGGLELHLYTSANGKWFLSTSFTPKKNSGLASCAGSGAAPPQGAQVWRLGKAMRGASDGETWADGELTLLCGDAGAIAAVGAIARAVRGLTQLTLPHERMSCSVSGTRERVIVAARLPRS